MMKLPTLVGLILMLACGRGLAANSAAPAGPAAPAKSGGLDGKVVETMNAATYTYVLLDTGTKKVWAAAPQFAVKVGDTVSVADGMPMMNYQSKTLNRTFDVVYFSGNVSVNGAPMSPAAAPSADLPKGHPPTDAVAKAPATPDLSGIKRAANGQTVAEIYDGKARLADKSVAVRGRVVKFNAMIMGKNWLHVRDGSGAEGTNDLTVTTATKVKVGDLVLVTGVLKTDRDFGGGYKYSLIVEDATVVVE
jgi:ribosomal protein S17